LNPVSGKAIVDSVDSPVLTVKAGHTTIGAKPQNPVGDDGDGLNPVIRQAVIYRVLGIGALSQIPAQHTSAGPDPQGSLVIEGQRIY
jgi:hypothetical protein